MWQDYKQELAQIACADATRIRVAHESSIESTLKSLDPAHCHMGAWSMLHQELGWLRGTAEADRLEVMADNLPLIKDPVPGKHDLYRCPRECNGCMFCDGGLSFCLVCRGAEIDLPTDCPGRVLTEEERKGICNGTLDFIKGRWVRSLTSVRDELGDCQRCNLCTTRKNIVWGRGNPNADLVFVGEGPGSNEDQEGQPFVGDAGELLNKMIAAMGYTDQCYITNVVKCRPPNNRTPERAEIAACGPFLIEQLRSINPRVIVALGATAAQFLLQTENQIGRLRGNFHMAPDLSILVMPTWHPTHLLCTPTAKREAWNDLKMVMGKLKE